MNPYYQHAGITIYHGDCRHIQSLGLSADACITDPPYGMDNDCDYTRFTMGPNGHGKASSRKYSAVYGDKETFDPHPWVTMKRAVFFGFQHFCDRLKPGTILVWLKRNDDAFGSFMSDADLAWMKGGQGVYCRRDFSLLAETNLRAHPTQKPVPLMEWVILKATEITDTIIDPYMGSGSTLIAAKKMGHKAIGIEIEEKYCEIAAKRLSQEVFDFSEVK